MGVREGLEIPPLWTPSLNQRSYNSRNSSFSAPIDGLPSVTYNNPSTSGVRSISRRGDRRSHDCEETSDESDDDDDREVTLHEILTQMNYMYRSSYMDRGSSGSSICLEGKDGECDGPSDNPPTYEEVLAMDAAALPPYPGNELAPHHDDNNHGDA